MRRLCIFSLLLVVPLLVSAQSPKAKVAASKAHVSAEAQACLDCHSASTPGVVHQWEGSAHARAGVDCYSCHKANEKDPATFDHYGQKIAVIVTPNYCARCHANETKQFEASHHAQAAQFIGSLDNMLGEIIEGGPAAENGCRQCHGSEVKYVGDGKFDPATWPNSGIGRVNPDGSRGTCAACHGRHSFSSAQARMPENCGKCHMGPDHPQIEIYNESKHGIQFRANMATMNLDKKSWVVGKDYWAAPTCATCHMSATSTQAVTHDVGDRISFTLRPVVSIKLENWQQRRAHMQDVCSNCHASGWVENFYHQYEDTVTLYNEKFAKPAKSIMDKLYASGKLTKTPFDEKIEWTYYELWHHQGRRARMGTAMMGPDYTQWHGFYEVAKTFYNEFIPEAEALQPGVTAEVMNTDYHKWRKGLSKEEIQQQIDFYKRRYEK
ncbi:MAG TPA: multiheme c-type cytochrome [Alphaproteobacteria bacterium]|nr:multiheme c-type cytochrome [Alphaproteobacteria bacterium]